MKLLAGLVATTCALTDEETAKFLCRDQDNFIFEPHSTYSSDAVNEYASAANNWNGCHYDMSLPCYRKQIDCSITVTVNPTPNALQRIQFESNGIADHNSWALTGRNSATVETNSAFRVPRVPELLPLADAVDAPQGPLGFAINGVAIFGPYNSKCCDATFAEIQSMDYCLGHPSPNDAYHYHYYPKSTSGYQGCLASCSAGETSGIIGIMKDGFPLYGPMQYYSASEGKMYLDPANCNDCVLMQLNNSEVDECGGIEVADGDATIGNVYRYISTGLFPYGVQCFRGDLTAAQSQSRNGSWRAYSVGNSCGRGGDNGDNCTVFNEDWVANNGCTPGNCQYSAATLGRKRREAMNPLEQYLTRKRRGTTDPLSEVYFQCNGCTNAACDGGVDSTSSPSTSSPGTGTSTTGGTATTGTGPVMTTTGGAGMTTRRPKSTTAGGMTTTAGTPMTTHMPKTTTMSGMTTTMSGAQTTRMPKSTTGGMTTTVSGAQTTRMPKSTTGGMTTTRTAPVATTTAGPNDGSDCEPVPVEFHGASFSKVLFNTVSKALVRVNVKDGNTGAAQNPYTGFAVFSRKACGQDFIEKLADGTVTFDMFDSEAEYTPQGVYMRDDAKHTSATIQWHRFGTDGKLSNAKRDQMYVMFDGLDQVNFGNKDQTTCVESAQIGAGAESMAAEDHTYCVGWFKTVGW